MKKISADPSLKDVSASTETEANKSGELKDLVRKFLQLSDLLNCLLLSILWNLA